MANAALTACSSRYGICEPAVTVAWNTDTSANTALLSTSWKKLLPISEVGTCPQIASTGAWDFLASYNPFKQVQRAGTHRAHAHAEGAGELGLGAGGESGDLLVAHADPFDAVIEPDGLGDGVQRIADDTPNLAHTEIGERVDDGGRDGGHDTP